MFDDTLLELGITAMNYQTKSSKKHYLIPGAILSISLLANCTRARSQISADDTVSTEVNSSNNISEITGGTTKGSNLFHSFQEFSVPQGNTAWFNNSDSIGNIISRVTGGTASNINGLIRANGNANLILINPSGINFGVNSRLDIGGSFLGSTANDLIFEDGTIFSANDPDASFLLTVSVPVGLQLGENSAAIDVRGTGHNLSLETTVFSNFTRGNVSGLAVDPGRTVTLIGNGLLFAGGTLAVESGEIQLGSVSQGTVGLNLTDRGWDLNYNNVSSFDDINLEQQALIDVSGDGNGKVELQGKEILLQDGSAVLSQNSNARGGEIEVKATESLTIVGTESTGEIASGLYSETLGEFRGADINIDTPQLIIEDGASIISTTSGNAPGGNVNIQATEFLRFVGFSTVNPNVFSAVSVQTFGSGNAGDILVLTDKFTALEGANISSITGSPNGTGSGGNVNIEASESIELVGANPITFAPSQITAGSGSPGNAGNVEVDTARLLVEDGARVDASATASGNAGNVTINATESIEVRGTFPGSINPSLITASANILDPALRSLFGLPDLPSGHSGSIAITTPRLQVADRGQVTVRNDGTGNAGNLNVAANSIELNDEGSITAAVRQGIGGKIELDAAESVDLTDGGVIISDNFGAEDGGEITLTANSLNISDRSFISTTSFGSGKGGDISLNIAEAISIEGTGYEQFQQDFQISALDGSLVPGTRGTGIFIGTATDGRSGNLKLDTGSLSLRAGAIISNPIFTNGTGGNIAINADDFEVSGSAVQITAGVDSTSAAAAGNITIATDRLNLRDGGTIVNATFGDAAGGTIDIDATEAISLVNTPDNSLIFTGIYANTSIGTGDSGGINLTTDSLYIDDSLITSNSGAFIRDSSLGFSGGGAGGDIAIEAAEKIEISGISVEDSRFVNGISSGSYFMGNAGNITISTGKLSLRDGTEIAAITTGSGDGGNLTIDAESIDLVGITTNNIGRGGLLAASGRNAFNPQQASGSSGDIKITTENLAIQNAARVDVQSLGTGDAGNLSIISGDSILLNNRGTISAAANSGNGGNINLIADTIFWRNRSTTTATASNDANGGNINIEANYLVALEASRLTADADTGRGGNINVNIEGLFVCQECQVSVSSQLGVDGIVNFTTLVPNPDLEVVDIPIQLTQPEEAVALACSATNEVSASRLTINGRGGVPPRPSEALNSSSIISFGASKANEADRARLPAPARNWYVNEQGATILTAHATGTPKLNSPDCHAL